MRTIIFMAVWLLLGAIVGLNWLQRACPHGGCSGILILLQVPELAVAGIVWLGAGLVGTAVTLSFTPVQEVQTPLPGRYCDGTPVRVGDRVRIGKTTQATGEVVFVHGQAPSPGDPEHEMLASLQQGFAVRTSPDDLHHFLVANPYVVRASRNSNDRAGAA